MALLLQLETEHGVQCEYHRVEQVQFNKHNNKTNVVLVSYLNEDCAKSGKQPLVYHELSDLQLGDLMSLYTQIKLCDKWQLADNA